MTVDIVPALLVRSKKELEQGLERLRGVAPWVQVDFVGSNYLEGEVSIPHWEEFDFEADLMLANQVAAAEAVVALGAGRVVVHAAGTDAHQALKALQQYRTGDFKVEVGVALRSHDTPDILKDFEGLYDYVQVMGIANVGHQGEPFDAQALELIATLRATYPTLLIQVDGGVSVDTAQALATAGANRLVSGSAILRAPDPKAAYKQLKAAAN